MCLRSPNCRPTSCSIDRSRSRDLYMATSTSFFGLCCATLSVTVGPFSASVLWGDSLKSQDLDLHGPPAQRDKYLYIWAGDELGVVPDFLTVVDFNENSQHYGEVIATASAPTSGNEAHHCHISADGDTILCGGLLSLLKDQDDIFFFDIS